MRNLLTILAILFCLNANALPTANAGPDKVIYLTQTNIATLNGSGTGTGLSYHWTEISTDFMSGGTITSPLSAVTTVSGLKQGTFYFELLVTDNVDISVADTVVVRVDYDVPPANSTVLSKMIFSDMAPVINLRDDTTAYFDPADQTHSRGGTIPNRYLFYRDRLQNMMIDSSRGKLYSIIRDGIPGGTGDFARSDMSIRNDLDNFPLDSNITYVMEWKGYFSPLPASANTAVIYSIHGNNEVSGPFSLRINGTNFGMSENFTSGQDNGKNATPVIPDSYVFTDFFPMTDIINRTRTIRTTFREGAGYAGQDAFIKVEVDGVLYYSRYTGQVGQTLQQDFPKMATLYDAAKEMIDPSNTTRGRVVSLTTEAFRIYSIPDAPPVITPIPSQTIPLYGNYQFFNK